MKITIAICTWNRARRLTRALESLARALPPRRAAWQVVVVDNNSSDDTARVIATFRAHLPLHAIFEARQGLAHARNAAIDGCDGDYFLWTDDDVSVGEDWLRGYEAAFDRHPDAAFFGGPIRPRFEGTPPRWLDTMLPSVLPAYAGIDVSADAIVLDGSVRTLPFGANLAIRGAEQRAFRFDPRLGRCARELVHGGDESDVLRRIVRAGGHGVWVPQAPVEHWIGTDRQSVRYLRAYYTGVGWRATQRAIARGRTMSARKLATTIVRLIGLESVYLAGRITRRPVLWVAALKASALLRGRLLAQQRAPTTSATEVGGR